MASACVNSEPFCWLSPRISFSRDLPDSTAITVLSPENPKPDTEFLEFEFLSGDSVTMLSADELFADGKLMPLHLAQARPALAALAEPRSPEPVRSRRRMEFAEVSDSPRAPRCSSRWRELLGLKRQQRAAAEPQKATCTSTPKYLKQLLHRHSKSGPIESSPLLFRDLDSEQLSRRSLSSSSSSSGADHEDLPRFSLDMEKQTPRYPHRARVARPAVAAAAARAGRSPARRAEGAAPRVATVDSPRMNASGRVVFQGLERSSSSPGSFVGGPRPRMPGMERSYSANVRVTPVLNVPVCSLRGSVFGLFSPQKKDVSRPYSGAGRMERVTQRD